MQQETEVVLWLLRRQRKVIYGKWVLALVFVSFVLQGPYSKWDTLFQNKVNLHSLLGGWDYLYQLTHS